RLQHPAVLAVVAAHPELEPERLEPILRIAKRSFEMRPIVGMHGFEPACAETFRRRDAGELVPGSRQEDARALGRGDPDHERRVVGELPEARLALAELRLGEPPLGDLLHDGRDADDLAMHANREEILLPRALLAGPRRR